MYQCFGASVTAHVVTMLSRAADRPTMKILLSGQRRRAVVPAIRGFLSEPIDPDRLAKIEAPTLVFDPPRRPVAPASLW